MLIGYARVSRDKQETALQLDALDKAGCQRVYVEKLSGASPERPELERCLDTLREGDTLIVWHLDRLGRSIKDLIEIVSSLKRQGIGFRSLTQSDIDTTTANGALVFHVFAALAEYERARLQERTRAGLEAARARGRRGGRPLAMSDDNARKARAMLSDVEITKAEVAKHFGVSRPTLNAALARLSPSDT
ncbi:TPA: recombinase family protein [Klebsiella pneumoniae]|nr:RecA: DNA recombinase [uncultured bacterium]EDS1782325.1 recombinase family protein [Salmonella enterica subsp. enterica serovar Braenderup]EHW8445383.1 recombinase family protein [Escherichia coli]HBS6326020.1 recombinase family protein [Klebsiella pneumoniae]HDI3160115.1 recombinase family protein [Vibrio cholerae]